MAERPALSVVLPTYNEAGSIVRFLAEVLDVVGRIGLPAEVVVVDDASPDGTADLVASSYGGHATVRVLRRTGARGLAVSIRDGIDATTAERLVVMDSDFNHDPQLLPLLVKYLDDWDLVSGSRFAPGGGMYSRTRQLGSYLMNLFARIVLQTQVQDNLSGYFAVRRAALARLPAAIIFRGYGDYYVRLLFHAQRARLRILEVPVVYRSREGGGSKTPLVRTAVRYGAEILRLRVTGR